MGWRFSLANRLTSLILTSERRGRRPGGTVVANTSSTRTNKGGVSGLARNPIIRLFAIKYRSPGDLEMKSNKNEKGFSLVELLVVVIIIAIVAAIAIPNLLASRRAANEASAVSSLRTYPQRECDLSSYVGRECQLRRFNRPRRCTVDRPGSRWLG